MTMAGECSMLAPSAFWQTVIHNNDVPSIHVQSIFNAGQYISTRLEA